jgi:hypothetical protein
MECICYPKEEKKEFFIHLKGETEKIHNSLIIRVYLCPSVVPFLFIGLPI